MVPGYRFYPTEEELISFYLYNKLRGTRDDINRVIPLLDIYQHEPPQLPNHYGELCNGDISSDGQWFFFVPRKEREVRGGRPTRTTTRGYWKATGSPSYVYSAKSKVIGVKKSMVFYTGKAPTGSKTQWKMNEYRAIEQDLPSSTRKLRHELSLCRVYVGSGTVRAFDRRPVSDIETSTSKKRRKINENDGCSSSVNRENANSDSPDLRQANQSGEDDESNTKDINEEEISLVNNSGVLSGLDNIIDWI